MACALFKTTLLLAAPVHLVSETPVSIEQPASGIVIIDFGKVAFGNLRLSPPSDTTGRITVHFGEALEKGHINRKPPGSVRYSMTKLELRGNASLVAAPLADARNTAQPGAILTPPDWGVITPFRWVEIEGWPGTLQPEQITRQSAFASTWDDEAADFRSSDVTLNRIWDLCRYSIKATTFAGVYVDGDRERIPYEADSYLNQLSHYATDNDFQMARDTFDHMMAQPTWPTEWASHMIFMAHADWMHSGDASWLAPRYEALKAKLLPGRAREDGLITSTPAHIKKGDIVDWPVKERDGFVFTPVNTVVNAFYIRTLQLMADLASALNKNEEASNYMAMEAAARQSFQTQLFDTNRGIYRDGEGTNHASQHANLFPLAFNLVPEAHRTAVTEWVAKRGMACSVYAAQYLMEGLFQNGATSEALALITAPGDRSWKHMLDSGTTITWEAWDQKYKPNQDWNHAWGAAPANLLPRFVLGAQVLTPGWSRALIRPNPGNLKFAEGKIPTPRGPILVNWKSEGIFKLSLTLPDGVAARIELPAHADSKGVFVDGKPVGARRINTHWHLDEEYTDEVMFEVK